jgi:two-component system response regulator YesN
LIRYAAYNIASELAAGERVSVFLAQDQRIWAIACEPEASASIAVLERTVSRIREKLREFLKIDSYSAIAEEASSIDELGRAIEQLKSRLTARYYANSRLMDETSGAYNDGAATEEEANTRLEGLAAQWIEAVHSGSRSAPIYLVSLERAMQAIACEPAKAKERLLRCVQELGIRLGRSVPSDVQEDIRQTVRLGEAFGIVEGYADRLENAARTSAPVAQGTNPELKEIDDYIREHMYTNVSSIDMARHLHLNPSYFSRYFKKLTGTIFTDYAHLVKMEEAKRLLVLGETAETTAYMLGYSDRAYFSKVFKKYTGMSPSECKQRQLEE